MKNGLTELKQHQIGQGALAGQMAVLLCAILWSTSGLFIKFVDWHPALISGGRSILSILVLFPVRRFFNQDKGPIKPTAIPMGFGYAGTMILFVFANKLTTSANAILLQFSAPIWVAILGWIILRERPRWENWLALLMIGPGLFLVLSGGLAGGKMPGNIIALLSGVTFALNSVILRKYKDSNPLDIMIGAHIISVLFSIPFIFLHPPQFTLGSVLSIVYMGVFQVGLASALFVYGIKRITAVQSLVTASIEPVLNPVWVLLVLGITPSPSVIAGGFIILTAVLFSGLVASRRASKIISRNNC